MSPDKFDGVIEAVRYTPTGYVACVRAYERRGPAFSDRILIPRNDLINRLKNGQRFAIGSRKPSLAGTFVIQKPVRLTGPSGNEVLTTNNTDNPNDDLNPAPLF